MVLAESKGREKNCIPPDPWIDTLAPLNRLHWQIAAGRKLWTRQPTTSTTQESDTLHELRRKSLGSRPPMPWNLLQLGKQPEASAVVAGCTLEREQWTTEFWMVTALESDTNRLPAMLLPNLFCKACQNVLETTIQVTTPLFKTSAQAHRLLGDYNAEEECWIGSEGGDG